MALCSLIQIVLVYKFFTIVERLNLVTMDYKFFMRGGKYDHRFFPLKNAQDQDHLHQVCLFHNVELPDEVTI